MRKSKIFSLGAGGSVATGVLQLASGAALDTTLRAVTDQANTVSPLQFSTTQGAFTFTNSSFKFEDGVMYYKSAGNFSNTYQIMFASPNTSNVFLGYGAGNLTLTTDGVLTGIKNTIVGYNCMPVATTAHHNQAVGFLALFKTTTGAYNGAYGAAALYELTTGLSNYAIGEHALHDLVSGESNIAMGYHAGELATGNYNIFLGGNAGTSVTTASNTLMLGYNVQPVVDTTTNGQANIMNFIYGSGWGGTTPKIAFGMYGTAIADQYLNQKINIVGNNASVGFYVPSAASGVRNYCIFLNSVEDGDFCLYRSSTNNGNPLSGPLTLRINNTGALGIGNINSTIPASALFEIRSTTQGFLPPRMTTAQKNAIGIPATGLVVFDTDLGKLCVYSGTWQTVTSV